ncbi:MAG: ribulose-phosphate 3-epimerase [Candidatus Babeliales bacterium]
MKQEQKPLIFPSLAAATSMPDTQTIHALECICDGFHLDLMDGHFVPHTALGVAQCNAIAQHTHKPLQFHLMVADPLPYIDQLNARSKDTVIVHAELDDEIIQHSFAQLAQRKIKKGVAINPQTPLERAYQFINIVDLLLLMAVEPGKSGQQFIKNTVARAQAINTYRTKHTINCSITVDGGINAHTIPLFRDAHIDAYAVGSAIFGATNLFEALQEINGIL